MKHDATMRTGINLWDRRVHNGLRYFFLLHQLSSFTEKRLILKTETLLWSWSQSVAQLTLYHFALFVTCFFKQLPKKSAWRYKYFLCLFFCGQLCGLGAPHFRHSENLIYEPQAEETKIGSRNCLTSCFFLLSCQIQNSRINSRSYVLTSSRSHIVPVFRL